MDKTQLFMHNVGGMQLLREHTKRHPGGHTQLSCSPQFSSPGNSSNLNTTDALPKLGYKSCAVASVHPT